MELYASRGSGTNADPFIIENLIIDSDFNINLCCITEPFAFIIQYCEFNNASLVLVNINSNFYGSSPFRKDVKILNNIFHDGGLFISSSLIHTVQNNSFYGISLGSRISRISMSYIENFCDNSFESGSIDITIASNYDEYPLLFEVFSNNTINGIEIGFFQNEFNLSISDTYSQLFVFNSTLINILNQSISDSFIGIKIGFCSNFTLTNSYIANCETAIYIRNSQLIIIQNCTFSNNFVGIEHENLSEYITIKFNQIVNYTSYAIFSSSSFCIVTVNNFIENAVGEFSQAYDIGFNNNWDFNYWSDWISGDYLIDGYGPVYEHDRNPLSSPVDF